MPREINPNMYPKSGYKFKEKDGSPHKSTSWAGVIKKVTDYRTRNGLPLGDVEAEVTAQACVNNPGICRETVPFVQVKQERSYASTIFQKVSNWLSRLVAQVRSKQIVRVPRAEAVRRAAICAKCPRQMAIPTVCGACVSQLSSFRRVVIGEQEAADKGLAACSVLGEDTQTSVHLELEPVTKDGLPQTCWRQTL